MPPAQTIEEPWRSAMLSGVSESSPMALAATWAIAVSGGMDSVVMLHALKRLAETMNKQLVVLHFNHQLRGQASDEDAEWVARLCDQWHLRCVIEKGHVSDLIKAQGLSMEMAARELRHGFLARASLAEGAGIVALAHHADDQLETLWLRWMRGSGPEGLQGMAVVASSPADPRCMLWRPFLSLSKDQFTTYARYHQLVWREDASNEDVRHQRNRLRHEVLPFIKKTFGIQGLRGPLRSCDLITAEHDLVTQLADAWELDANEAEVFSTLHRGLQRELMRRALIRLEQTPNYDMIELLVDAKLDQGVMLEQGLKVCRLESMPLLQAQGDPGQESFARGSKPQEILLSGDSSQALFDGCQITWSRQPIVGQVNPVSSSPFSECFDADVLGEQVWLRHWQAGDRMTLIGSHGSSKLQDVFTNLKWSALQRHQALVAHDRRGRIFWVEGLRIADFAKMTPATRHVLTWTWNRSLA